MLEEYGEKRDFSRTPEPKSRLYREQDEGPLIFVVQKHAARRTHYDFRLELDGVLKSWAVTVGPSLDPKVKRLAVMVEDHPLDYASFEGVIPAGEYGAGQVIVWDTGTYSLESEGKLYFHDRATAQELMRKGLADGKLSFVLRGSKLKGSWTLVRMKRSEKDWLLIKHQDEFASTTLGTSASAERKVTEDDRSVLSGLTIEDLKAGQKPVARAAVRLGEIAGARPVPFPSSVAPMLASLVEGPFSDPDWFYEPKLDGYRIIAMVQQGKVQLLSRRGNDVTDRYQHLVTPLSHQLASELVLDGELIAVDERGKVCFQCLQQYLEMMKRSRLHRDELRLPIYYVFDILFLDGYDLRDASQQQRRAILERVLLPSDTVRLIERFEGDGRVIYEAAVSQGLEGVIAKRKDSLYESERRSRDWLKIKATLSDEFVIGGYSQGFGARSNTFGALLLGYYDDQGQLIYAGHVGTGFDEETLEDLRHRLDSLKMERCPFIEKPPLNAPTTWVRPELVAEVKFSQWTKDGLLRVPVFIRLREDKAPAEVSRTQVVTIPGETARVVPSPVILSLSKACPEQDEWDETSNIAHGSTVSPRAVDKQPLLEQLRNPRANFAIEVEGYKLALTNMDKELWTALDNRRALTKRDLLVYLAKVSPYLLPHLQARPLTLRRYPDGIYGEHFYQKHWDNPLPEFVETAPLTEHDTSTRLGTSSGLRDYLLCNNLPTLLWLGNLANIEFHTWFSRVVGGHSTTGLPPSKLEGIVDKGTSSTMPPSPRRRRGEFLKRFGSHRSPNLWNGNPTPGYEREFDDAPSGEKTANSIADYPDFIVFDIDPYIYSGREAAGAEPELNRAAFAKTGEIVRQLKTFLDSVSLHSFVKTSGKTGLHVFVPVLRQFDYAAVRSAAETICRFVLQQNPRDVTIEWVVERRTGKVFLDYNQNVRGKTLASAYSPRPTPEATVSVPLRWEEVGEVYPTDFTILTVPDRVAKLGDPWAGILDARQDLRRLLDLT